MEKKKYTMNVVRKILKNMLTSVLRPRGKGSFIRSIQKNGKVLDVGCGNNSPFHTKTLRHDLYYVGLDIGDYNQTTDYSIYADKYLIATSSSFAAAIGSFKNYFDAVISSHNIEHCQNPIEVLKAITASLKSGGKLYLSFPCEASMFFPKRHSTLNFYTDPTHIYLPNFDQIINMLRSEGYSITFAKRRYRPIFLFVLGMLLEPIAFITKRNMPIGSTWALYGFETVIWATRQ